jgi:MSHA biogenesis protein MshO
MSALFHSNRHHQRCFHRRQWQYGAQDGFTLVEAIVVIVITGIIAGIVAIFIRLPVQGYVDSVARAQLTDVADSALRRIARDVRLALPNSVRVSPDGKYLELLLTKTGGRYLAQEDNPAGGNILNFDDSTKTTFDVVGAMPSAPQNIVVGDYIVVYNLSYTDAPSDAYADCSAPASCNIARITGIAGNTLTLASNPFAKQTVQMKSPTMRFQVVTTPVTYFCDSSSGTLTRYWGYSILPTQPISAATLTGAGATSAKLATNVAGCVFSNTILANMNSGLVGLTITLSDPNNTSAGTVVLSHQVHVDNTP